MSIILRFVDIYPQIEEMFGVFPGKSETKLLNCRIKYNYFVDFVE